MLAYGMSEFKLSADLGISVPEAKKLLEQYFTVFPKIKRLLDYLGRFGVENGYIMTHGPFYRKRWFPFWYENRRFIYEHTSGMRFNSTLGEIERASKNHPFQGSAADMVKVAMVMVRNFINDHGYDQDIFVVAQVHDQLTTVCRKELAEWWRGKFDQIMRDAAAFIIPSGILKADTQITGECWTK